MIFFVLYMLIQVYNYYYERKCVRGAILVYVQLVRKYV